VVFSPQAKAWALVPKDKPGQLITVDVNGKTKTIVASNANAPLWSPDGTMISWVEGDPLSSRGWRIHVIRADGSGDRVLTDWLPLLQSEPPVPGPKAKRVWVGNGKQIVFNLVGRDYGAAERAGIGGAKAGDDIENLWIVPVDGSARPHQATDLTRVFYLRDAVPSPDGDTLAVVGFSYLDRVQQLWTLPAAGGKPTKIDADVRWVAWER
jgi:Tol biopolymer transport system component